MLMVYPLFLLPLLTATETTQPTMMQESWKPQLENSTTPADWISDSILNAVDDVLPVTRSSFEARKKKRHKLNKYILPLIVGVILIKSILLPIALKTLAILSGKAVVLSLMSLILAAIVGLKKVAQAHSTSYEVVNMPVNKYKRQDFFEGDDTVDTEPYKFYRERHRKK
ncbi:uncharacterized protein LOC117233962 [Bombus vosnesenskii]|uniref:Uncharacterized protein LOC117233962 n=2 Tax=Pyrobombus TaxID=144703 RepID=A0A6J3KCT8_9HYME|nr:uncharacterized protein LOC112213962 [Bombus impatiens]XP_033350595.1 uncharacterized protein LOC117233962 [Bombus vosnesenskii]XP_050484790.1 uncharacterized protein LOC126870795 [Bombus huntii]